MRVLLTLMLLGLAVAGCAHQRPAAEAARPPVTQQPAQPPKLIVTPEENLSGKVLSVNTSLRFVILNFPLGHLPPLGSQLNVYRLGLKVGEVKVNGPQRDDNIVADLFSGEAAKGDEVRAN